MAVNSTWLGALLRPTRVSGSVNASSSSHSYHLYSSFPTGTRGNTSSAISRRFLYAIEVATSSGSVGNGNATAATAIVKPPPLPSANALRWSAPMVAASAGSAEVMPTATRSRQLSSWRMRKDTRIGAVFEMREVVSAPRSGASGLGALDGSGSDEDGDDVASRDSGREGRADGARVGACGRSSRDGLAVRA